MRVVVALDGRMSPPSEGAGAGRAPAQRLAAAIAAIAAHHAVVVVHGNGPQAGRMGREAAAVGTDAGPPGDATIGYLLERALMTQLPGRRSATMLIQAEISQDDPALARPSVPVGPAYDADKAARLAAEHGWVMGGAAERFRRLLPALQPLRILEIETIRLLVERNVVVVCAGGGGVPVALATDGEIRGVDGVVDRDRTAALLAEGLSADFLLLLGDAEAVASGWDTPRQRAIRRAAPDRLRTLRLGPPSTISRIEAACDFVGRTGGTAAIGALDAAAEVLRGAAGTTIVPGREELEYRDG